MMKKTTSPLLIMAFMGIVLMSGCWNYREINTLAIVSGAAVDKGKEEKYMMTVEVISFSGGGKEAKIKSERITGEGTTLFDTVRNLTRISPKKLYWSHSGVFIISQEVAKESILPFIDYVARGTERRLRVIPIISKGKTAKEMLGQHIATKEVTMFGLKSTIETERKTSAKTPYVDVRHFINSLSGEGVSATLSAISSATNNGKLVTDVAGTAVFKRDKLTGFLSPDETKYFLFATDKIKGGVIPTDSTTYNIHGVSLEIFESKTHVKPVYNNDNLSFQIKVHSALSIQELGQRENVIASKGMERLKASAESTIKKGIEQVIHRVQKDFGSDIFGFGAGLKRDRPEVWKKFENNWSQTFSNLKVQVDADVDIRDSSMLTKPIKVGD